MPIFWLGKNETHTGLVLEVVEENRYDDSDWFAIVWNADKGAPERHLVGTTRMGSDGTYAKVDATPEVKEAYLAAKQAKAEAEEAKWPRKGKRVRIVKGRNKGVEGELVWQGPNTFVRQPKWYSPITALGYYTSEACRWGVEIGGGERVFVNGNQIEVLSNAPDVE
jgi:hypothetical protein